MNVSGPAGERTESPNDLEALLLVPQHPYVVEQDMGNLSLRFPVAWLSLHFQKPHDGGRKNSDSGKADITSGLAHYSPKINAS
jgi:hypothetical protein